ncbi:hypothetical protein EIP91_006930 [Steccherinum ochraceum]|uniref:Homeobox domain-containing protein n=1 Tax=Steccherinum ochraceum TaxID=92696 RepID=A0A4R0R521_9APHY|nr:hypothetical protein EIP91_006930 [Steccherinum ochraceum]
MPRSLASSTSSAEIPFARKRLHPQQLAILKAVFDSTSHPSLEERADLAAELGLEIKAINVWYQNKRRSVKKQTQAWNLREMRAQMPPHHPLSRSDSSSSANSSNRASISLDSIVEARERPDPVPRTPKRRQRTSTTMPRMNAPESIWELIPSSPILPPSSPAAESVRMSALPATSKTMRSLEWACAKDRAGRKKRKRNHGAKNLFDVPPLPSLNLESAKEGTEVSDTEVEDLITPDNSMELAHLHTPQRKRMEEDWMMEEEEGCRAHGPPGSGGEVEAAITLLGFKVRS